MLVTALRGLVVRNPSVNRQRVQGTWPGDDNPSYLVISTQNDTAIEAVEKSLCVVFSLRNRKLPRLRVVEIKDWPAVHSPISDR